MSGVVNAVGDVVSGVGDIAQGAVNAVGDATKQIDDVVGQIPGGWATVAAVTGMYYSPEIGAYINGATGETVSQEAALQAAQQTASQTAAQQTAGTSLGSLGSGTFATPGDLGTAFVTQGGLDAAPTVGQLTGGASGLTALGSTGGASSLADIATGAGLASAAPAVASAATGNALSNALPYLAAGNVASSLLGANAAKTAADLQAQAANRGVDLQKYIFDTLNQQQAPYRQAGYSALSDIQGQLPYLTSKFTPQDFAAGIDPGYAFRLKQGQMAAQRAGNMKGMTGNVLTGLQDYTQGLASQEYQNAFNRNIAQKQNIYNTLAGIAGIGQTAQGQTGQAAGTYGTNASNLMTGGAAAQAAGQVGAANALSGGLGNVMNTYTLASLLNQNPSVA